MDDSITAFIRHEHGDAFRPFAAPIPVPFSITRQSEILPGRQLHSHYRELGALSALNIKSGGAWPSVSDAVPTDGEEEGSREEEVEGERVRERDWEKKRERDWEREREDERKMWRT